MSTANRGLHYPKGAGDIVEGIFVCNCMGDEDTSEALLQSI